jgi:hypothetical protein
MSRISKDSLQNCVAPPGQLRVVQVDPRDHFATREVDVPSLEKAQEYLNHQVSFARETMTVFDDKGQEIVLG